MLHIFLCVAAILVSQVGAAKSPGCATNIVPTVEYLPNVPGCSHVVALSPELQPQCFFPAVPQPADALLIPSGAVVTWGADGSSYPFYVPWHIGTLIIAQNAVLRLVNSSGIRPDVCLDVQGILEVLGVVNPYNRYTGTPPSLGYWDQNNAMPYPFMSNCTGILSGGFAPRICGAGTVSVHSGGFLRVGGYYASLWSTVAVGLGGHLQLEESSFLWGEVNNHGRVTVQVGAHFLGQLNNYANAEMQFVLWENFDRGAITIVNFATLSLDGPMRGYESAVVVNHGNMLVGLNLRQAYYDLDLDFSLVNDGNVTAAFSTRFNGVVSNAGAITANGTNVFFSQYQSDGGELIHINGGSFTFGSGAGVDPVTIPPACDVEARAEMLTTGETITHAKTGARSMPCVGVNLTCPDGFCCFDGSCIVSQCGQFGICCAEPCDVYHTGAYCGIYAERHIRRNTCRRALMIQRFGGPAFFERVKQTVRSSSAIAEEIRHVSTSTRRKAVARASPARYSFFGISIIRGDGSGSVLISEPMHLVGTIVVKSGGRLFSMTERRASIAFGAGSLEAKAGGQVAVGIESSLAEGIRVLVRDGGRLFVPRFGDVSVGNASVTIEHGGHLHVDGTIRVEKVTGRPQQLCLRGELRGEGLFRDDTGDAFSC